MDKQKRTLALKRNEVLTHSTIWMNLEDIMLSDDSQSQKDKYCMIPLNMRHLEWSDSSRQKGWWVSGAEGSGTKELFNGDRVSVLHGEKSSGGEWW